MDPKVQQLIKDFFNGKAPNRGIKPREIAAYGAAVQAAILSVPISSIVLVQGQKMTPLTRGFKLRSVMTELINRFTLIPTRSLRSSPPTWTTCPQ